MQTHFLFDVLDGYKPFEQMAQESQNSGAVIAASGMAGAQNELLVMDRFWHGIYCTKPAQVQTLASAACACSPRGKSRSIRMWRPAARWPIAASRRCAGR